MKILCVTIISILKLIDNTPGIQYKDQVKMVYAWESGWGKSTKAKHHHNLFGLKYSKYADYKIPQSAYAGYTSYESCILDYRRLQQFAIKKYQIKSEKEYIHYLNTIYQKNPNYYNKCLLKTKKKILQYQKLKNSSTEKNLSGFRESINPLSLPVSSPHSDGSVRN